MKIGYLLFLLLSIFISCNSSSKSDSKKPEDIVFQQKDKVIIEEVLELFSGEKETSTSVLVVKVGTFFKETPYVANTLEFEPEQLVINLRELDCTTFAENCLAIARTIKSGKHTFDQFTSELKNIRFRDGKLGDYPSRLHYFSDWIYNNTQKKLVNDVSAEIAQTPYPISVNFMSTHPESYMQLKTDSLLIPVIAEQEKEICARKMFYIPEDRILEFEDKLMDGDIAGITTSIGGMDIQHVVILIRKAGRMHLLHASLAAGKVLISEETLEEYLKESKRATGIMVARPL